MKTKTIRKLLIWTASVFVILVIGIYFAFDYATNYVLRTIANSALEAPTPASSEKNPEPALTPSKEESATKGSGEQGGSTTPSSNPPQASDPAVSGTGEDDKPKAEAPTKSVDTALPLAGGEPASNSGTNSGTGGATAGQGGANITPEHAQQAQEQITVKDKAKVSSVLLSKLSASDLKLFMKMSEGGVSVEEKLQAKKLILQKLTEEEYNELIAIAAKLGLSSSGMNYQDSKEQVANTP